MKRFKFLQKENLLFLSNNNYWGFDADMWALNYVKYRYHRHEEIVNNDINLTELNIPFSDFFLRVTTWRHITSPIYGDEEIIEIDYKIIQDLSNNPNNNPNILNISTSFTLRMVTRKLMEHFNETV